MKPIRLPLALAAAVLALSACGGGEGGPVGCIGDCQNNGPGDWDLRAQLPTPRQEMAAVALAGRVYVAGGIAAGNQVSAVVEVYDPAADDWRTGPALPLPRHHHAAAATGGRVYVMGGYASLATPWAPVRTVWELDPAGGTWRARAPLPSARGAAAAVALDGKVYLFGGAAGAALSQALVYDPAEDEWTQLAPMPTAREHLAAVVVGSEIYVIGGRAPNGAGINNLNVVEVYTPASNSWRTRASVPAPVSGHAAAAMGGRIYLFGGEHASGVFRDTREYDPVDNEWRSVASLPTGRTGLGAAAVGGAVHVLGGAGAAGTGAEHLRFTMDEGEG